MGSLWSPMKQPAFVVLAIALGISCFAVLPYIRGDGNGYYAWLRSPAIDHDLQFGDEFAHGDPAFLRTVYAPDGSYLPGMITDTGHVRNQWSVGAAILWAPFFLVGHLIVLAGRAVGHQWPEDGWAMPYVWMASFGTAVYASIGLLLSARVARNLFPIGPVVLGTVAVWLASSLPIYQYFLPFMAMACASFVAALLLFVWVRPGWGIRRWGLLGLLAGFLVTVHPVGLAWLALPATSILGLEPGAMRQRVVAVGVAAVGAVLGSLPEFIGKAIVNGSPFDTGYQAQWSFLHPHMLRVLFGAEHGLLSWTPVLLFALVGLGFTWKRDRRLGIGLVAVFAAMLYLVSVYATAEQSSYGNRFFVLFTPGFVVGASALAAAVWSKRAAAIGVVAALIIWNSLFMFQWAWGLVPKRGAVAWSTMAKQQFTEAPSGMVHAAHLFFTDRAELIRIVQSRDLDQLQSGDVAGSR